ncbi:MAG: HAD family hydrolase [Candidatus Campbellbacteria bacterium]|nr:HAD family hydrolase [Candidatus Campbellbacteria bacterium]
MTMYAVFDFDGVLFVGIKKLKSFVAEEEFGICMTPEQEENQSQYLRGVMREKGTDYSTIFLNMVYSEKYAMDLKPAEGALECVRQLQELGVDVSVVSSRYKSIPVAKEMLKKRGFPIKEIRGVGYSNSKWDDIQRPGPVIFFDDSPEKILPILEKIKECPGRYTGPKTIKPVLVCIEEEQYLEGVDIVRSWDDIYNAVRRFGGYDRALG